MTDAERVTEALIALCFRAGVAPDDGSDAAGRAVAGVLRAELRVPARAILHCPLNTWLAEVSSVPQVLVTTERALLPHVVTATRNTAGNGGYGRKLWREFASVPLPPAVRAAVEQYDALKWFPREEVA